MKAYFRIKSDNPNAVYYASITPEKKDSTPYDICIRGREVYYTEVKEEIDVLRADTEMIVEVHKKDVNVKEAEIEEVNDVVVEEPKETKQDKQKEKAERDLKKEEKKK